MQSVRGSRSESYKVLLLFSGALSLTHSIVAIIIIIIIRPIESTLVAKEQQATLN